MISMAKEEFSWIDDAFKDEAQPSDGARQDGSQTQGTEGYDWIDDAFDEAKEDPLARKGMTGCSSLAVVICVIAVVIILAIFAFMLFNAVSLFDSGM